MFPEAKTASILDKSPTIRPVYMYPGELPHSVISSVAIAHTDTYIALCIHPAASTPQVVADIAYGIDLDHAPAWLRPFGHAGPIDLTQIRVDPVGALGIIARIPNTARLIPTGLQLPWAPWMYN